MLVLIYIIWLVLINTSIHSSVKESKKIVVVLFPGGRKVNKQLKILIDYTNKKETDYIIQWHIVLYKTDYEIWKDYEPFIHSFGQSSYLYNGINDLDEEPQQSFFAYHQIKLRWFYQEFLESNIMKTLEMQKLFDMIITDVPNYIAAVIAKKFDIQLRIIASMRPQPQLFEGVFELNPNYYPILGSLLSNDMTYQERCNNLFKHWSYKLIHYIARYEIRYLFKIFGFVIEDEDHYLNDTLIMIQYPKGITFPLSVPPNFILLNAVFPNLIATDSEASFTSEKIILITEEALHYVSDYLFSIIEANKEIEFYINREAIDNSNSQLFTLMANEKVIGLLSTGDLNAISQSLYHFKPVIVIGKGLRDSNVKAFIKKMNCGITIDNISLKELNSAIKKVFIENNLYKRNTIKYGNILRGNRNGKEQFVYWLEYGLKNNYSLLNVPLYRNGFWLQKSCFDVFGFTLVIIFISLKILFELITYTYQQIRIRYRIKEKQN